MARHRLASPDCAFVTDQSDNVPVLTGGEEEGGEGGGGEETLADEAPPPPENHDLSSYPPTHPRHHLTSGLSTDQSSQDRLSPEGPTELDFRSEADIS